MATADLYSRIEEAQDIVDLAAALLSFCRRHEMDYRRADNHESSRAAEASLSRQAAEWFQGRSEELDTENRHKVLQALREPSEIPLVVRARAIAVGLDRALGRRFYGVFRGVGVRPLEPNSPVLVRRPPLKEILGSLNAPPERLDPRVDRLPNLRLAPAELYGFEIDLDFSLQDAAGPICDREHQVFVTCHPNASLAELVCHEDGNTPPDSFFWFQPKDAKRQDRIVRALLQKAAEAGAGVVLFPELCLEAEAAQRWLDELESPPSPVRLLVAGSHHVEVGGRRRNQALALLRGSRKVLRHWKNFRYVDKKLGREDIYEDTPGFTVYFSGGWSFAIVICKDFLVERVRQMLEALAVNLVLIPSLTGSATPFEGFVPLLTQTHQAFVMMANSPAEESGVHAIFSYPAKREASYSVPAGGLGAPGICVHRPGRSWSWIDLEEIFD
ncbi:MAG TPA: hypothetical protein VF173_26355 [Thermoanaerobaculia bacterium]|nr:hypothetical protein [Thermoanaerobaculia bacterium]